MSLALAWLGAVGMAFQDRAPMIRHQGIFPQRSEGDEEVYVLRKPEYRHGNLFATAERAVVFFDREELKRAIEEGREGGDPLQVGPELPRTESRDLLAESRRRVSPRLAARGPVIDVSDEPFRHALRIAYLEGDVRVRETDEGRSASADALFLDAVAGRLLILSGEIRLDLTSSGRPLPLVVRAALIRQEITGSAIASGAEITTCSLATPHYHLRTQDLRLQSLGANDVSVEAEGNALEVEGVGALPLPDLSVYSTDLRLVPVESIVAGHSRRDGAFFKTRLGSEIRDLGDEVNRSLGIEGEFRGRWSVEAEALSRRGGALGGTVDYETRGVYRGTTTGYYLNDRGKDVGFLSDIYDESGVNRGRIHTENRVFAGSNRSWVDLEISHSSDPLLRPEFFPSELKTEKRHENVLYYRTAGDSLSFTSLLKSEIDAFEPVVETGITSGGISPSSPFLPGLPPGQVPPSTTNAHPFLDGRLYSMPIAKLGVPAGVSGTSAGRELELVYRARASAGYLELHFAEADLQPTLPPLLNPLDRRAGRFDTVHELSTPFSLGVAKAVPFVELRETVASEGATSSDEVSRFLATVGARVGSHLERDFGAVRHALDALVEYRNRFESTAKGTEFIPFDEVDPLDRIERIDFDLRNRLSRKDADTRRRTAFADLQVGVPYFPDASRDNAGEPFGDIRTDVRFDFGPQFFMPDLRVRSRARLDSERLRTRKSDHAVLASPFGPELDLSIAYRESRPDYEALALAASYRVGRKWDLDVLEQFDFVENRSLQHRVLLRRYAHDWALEISFSFDSNENSQSISFAILPLLGSADRPRDRFFVPEPMFRGFY
jgi:hypothetical protein